MRKTCTKCGLPKPLDEFYESPGNKDGRRNVCIPCWKERNNERKKRAEKAAEPPKEGVSCDVSGDTQTVTCTSHARTLDEVLKIAQVDLKVWTVERWIANKWEVAGKFGASGEPDERFEVQDLWQVKVWLARRIPKPLDDAVKLLSERLAKLAPKYPKLRLPKLSDPHLLEISINDIHFAKLAWGVETDGDNYDLDIAESLYEAAVKNLVAKATGFNIERILLPVGNDFFHVDGPGNTTANGTPQDTDGRYVKMFVAGEMAVVKAIRFLQQIAPVDVIWVGGNHDRLSSWHVVHAVKAHFGKTDRVKVDDAPTHRKYYPYGVQLIGFTHGDEEKHGALPNLMAMERPDLWAATRHREWHLGHWHKRKETQHVGTDTHEGVIVRVLPSLSARDAWHARKGYIGTRAADAFLFSKANGPAGQFTAHVNGERKVA